MAVSRFVLISLIATMAMALPGMAADASLVNLVMPDAKSVAGIAVEQARTTPFGQFVLSRMQQQDANFQKLITDTGFDPRTDLTEIVVASNATTPADHGQGLLVARGRFDVVKILAAAQGSGGTATSYAGVQVLLSKAGPNGKQGAVAFPDSTLAIAGDLATVQATLDRRASGGAGVDAGLASKVSQVSAQNHMWFVTNAPAARAAAQIPGQQPNPAMTAQALKTVQQLSGGVNFGQTVLISVEAVTKSDQDATALADVVRFLAGMVQSNPNSAHGQQLATLLNSMQITTSQNLLKLALSLPEDQIEAMMRQAPHRAPAARRHHTERQLD